MIKKYFFNLYLSCKKGLISRIPLLYILIKNNLNFKKTSIDLKGYNIIKQKGLFDIEYYLKKNPQVSKAYGDPILHYLFKGFEEGKNPSLFFDGDYYFKRYSDTRKSGLNPLIHYSIFGLKENRVTFKKLKNNSLIKRKHYSIAKSGLFDEDWYKINYNVGMEHPILHYLTKGVKKKFNPNPLFDSKWYLRKNDLKNKDPFLHFIEKGFRECLNPHPLFSVLHYQKSQIKDLNLNPLRDYIETGRFKLLTPSPNFNIDKKVISLLPEKYKYRFTSSPILSKVDASIYLDSFFKMELNDRFMDFNSYIRLSTLKKKLIEFNLNKSDMYIVAMMENQKRILFDKYINRPQKELVSIIMPTHNRAKTIVDSIISVISQSYKNWELIIVDDGGIDNTYEVISEFNNEKIIYHRLESNLGSSHARNVGLAISKGSIIAYLDDDDVWDPEMLLISVNALRDANKKSIYSAQIGWDGFNNISRIGNKFEFIRFSPFNWSLIEHGNYISMIAFVHDKSLIENVGGFDESLKQFEDWDFILKCCEEEFPVAIPCILSHYFLGRCEGHISSSKESPKSIGPIYDRLAKRSSWNFKITFNNESRLLFGISDITQRKRREKISNLPKERVTILIPHHEDIDNLQVCVESIARNTSTEHDILICDNGSSNETRMFLDELSNSFDNIKCIKMEKDSGFSHYKYVGGVHDKNLEFSDNGLESSHNPDLEFFHTINTGLKEALKKKQDIVILHSDTITTPNWLEELRIILNNNQNVGMAIPRHVIAGNNDTTRLHSPNSYSDFEVDISLSDFHENVIGPYDENGCYELKYASLTCALIRYEDLIQSNFFFDENNPKINFEWIYSDTFRYNTGKNIVYTPYSKIYHLQK